MPFSIRPFRRFPVQGARAYHVRPSLMPPLACIAGCWFLITLLALTNGAVSAEWVAIDERYQSPGLQTVYIDPATIHREGNRVTVWQLTDYKWAQGNVGLGRFGLDPSRFLSTTTHKEFDCAQKRLRLLAHSSFLKHMGTGRRNDGYVDKDHWLPVRPETINHALWEVACGTS